MLDEMGWLNTKIIFVPTKDSYDHHPQLLPDPVLLLPNLEYCETENIKVGHYVCHFKGINEMSEFCQLQRSKMTPGSFMIIFFHYFVHVKELPS